MIESQDYIQRNLRGFEGDPFLKQEIKSLVAKFGIDIIIETGTFIGGTTRKFAGMVDKVITIESNKEYFEKARLNIDGLENVKQVLGQSQTALNNVLTKEVSAKNLLFFLDAHWGDYCPLKAEMKIIASKGIKPVIVVHDFYNPFVPDMGFDTYNGKKLNFAYIEPELKMIYGRDYEFYYNKEAGGARRGVIFVHPAVVDKK